MSTPESGIPLSPPATSNVPRPLSSSPSVSLPSPYTELVRGQDEQFRSAEGREVVQELREQSLGVGECPSLTSKAADIEATPSKNGKSDIEKPDSISHLVRAFRNREGREQDFPEDFAHENGNYRNLCCVCGVEFMGHKRRVVCRKCESAPQIKIETCDGDVMVPVPTLESIAARVQEIKDVADDDEMAHCREDDLMRDFIAFVATQWREAPALAEMAKLVISTQKINFTRWHA